MHKQFEKKDSIINPELYDKIKKKDSKIYKEIKTFNNNVWWKRLFRWIFYKK